MKPFSIKVRPFQAAVHRSIQADAALVWDILTDTRRWPEWGPSVMAVDHEGAHIHASSAGRVQIPLGIWLPFRVTRFQPGRSWSWRVSGIPATGHRVEPGNPGECDLSFEVPVLAAPYLAVCREAARRIARIAEQMG